MKIYLYSLIQRIFRLFGLHVRRLSKGVEIDSSTSEQFRLAGNNVRVVIEVGAADGRDTAMYAERYPAARLVAYEPHPENFAKLALRASAEPRIIPVNAAVSQSAGAATFHITALPDASSLLKPRQVGGDYDKYLAEQSTVDVRTVTLDDECQRLNLDHIDLLKMDAQGGELDILRGAANLLQSKRIKVIYTEVNFVPLYDGSALYHDLAKLLEGFGYRLHNLYNLVSDRNGNLSWGDAIFVIDDKAPQSST